MEALYGPNNTTFADEKYASEQVPGCLGDRKLHNGKYRTKRSAVPYVPRVVSLSVNYRVHTARPENACPSENPKIHCYLSSYVTSVLYHTHPNVRLTLLLNTASVTCLNHVHTTRYSSVFIRWWDIAVRQHRSGGVELFYYLLF